MVRFGRRRSTAAAVALSLTLLAPALPAAAQTGRDQVTFWDDPDIAALVAPDYNTLYDNVPPPNTAPYSNMLAYLNPAGGRTSDDGLFWMIGDAKGYGEYNVVRERDWQIYGGDWNDPRMEFSIYARQGATRVVVEDTIDVVNDLSDPGWDETVVGPISQPDSNSWTVVMTQTTTVDGVGDFSVVTTNRYSLLNPRQLDITARVSLPAGLDEAILYFGSDMFLDGSDRGPGILLETAGGRLIGQQNATAAGGILEVAGSTWTSYFEGYYDCWKNDCDDVNDADGTTGPFGPSVGTHLPNLVNFAEGSAPADIDAAVGVSWDISSGTSHTIRTQLFFTSTDDLASFIESLGSPDDGGDEENPPPARVCSQTADVAISPQFINLTPGSSTTLEIAMRNVCGDAVSNGNSLLLSLSDGLRVAGLPTGWLDLGQRAALEQFSLQPGETKRWSLTISAADPLPTAPLHVLELFRGSSVATRIDGVFVSPTPVEAPAAAEPAPAAPVIEAAPAAAPAPLPSALPNTAGEQPFAAPAGLLIGLAAVLLGAGLSRRFVRR